MGYYDEDDYYEDEEDETMAETKCEVIEEKDLITVTMNPAYYVDRMKNMVVSELKKAIIDDIKKELIDDMREDLKRTVNEEIHAIVKEVYANHKVVTGSFYDDEAKEELTVDQYIMKVTRDCVARNGTISVEYKDRWNDSCKKQVTIKDYIDSKISYNELKKTIDREIEQLQNRINIRAKQMFDDQMTSVLSNTVVNILMQNDTYKKVYGSIAEIATKEIGQ